MAHRLTSREQQLRDLLLSGLHTPAITHRMGISAGTLRIYCHRIYVSCGVTGRVELMAKEIERLRSVTVVAAPLVELREPAA